MAERIRFFDPTPDFNLKPVDVEISVQTLRPRLENRSFANHLIGKLTDGTPQEELSTLIGDVLNLDGWDERERKYLFALKTAVDNLSPGDVIPRIFQRVTF